MIRYVLFNRKGSQKKGTGQDYPKPKKGDYLLLFLTKPSREQIDKVSSDFILDKRPLMALGRETQMRRHPNTPSHFIVGYSYLENEKVEFASMVFALAQNCIIVASPKDSDYYDRLTARLFDGLRKSAITTGIILSKLLQEDMEENYKVLNRTEEQIHEMELKAAEFKKEPKIKTDDLVYMKTVLFRLSKQLWAKVRVASMIRLGRTLAALDPESTKAFGDVQENLRHQVDIAAGQKEMLSDALRVYTTGVTNRVTEKSHEVHKTLKSLTAFSVIFFTAALATAKFSANLKELPLTTNLFGFYIITGLTLAIMAGAFTFVKIKQWA